MSKKKSILKAKKDHKRKVRTNRKELKKVLKNVYQSNTKIKEVKKKKATIVKDTDGFKYYLPELNCFELKDLEKK